MKITQILISGFGGQGIMSLGKALAATALAEGKYPIYFPSYGAEVRGGTAYCFVKISGQTIASPLIDAPDIAIIMNQPSLDKFEKTIVRKGLLIVNTDLVTTNTFRGDLATIAAPLNALALSCGNLKVANTIALGILVARVPDLLKEATITRFINATFGPGELLRQNTEAFRKGIEFSKNYK
ncbi:MAG: 2-oxoacid:acceptor oxidoreductase family protein [Candidatus Omnitrophota bacterium]